MLKIPHIIHLFSRMFLWFKLHRRQYSDLRRKKMLRRLCLVCNIAGVQYHMTETVWSNINAGDALTLVRDSHNRHDPWAVALVQTAFYDGHPDRLLFGDDILGYIPRQQNKPFAHYLDTLHHKHPGSKRHSSLHDLPPLVCHIVSILQTTPTSGRITIAIHPENFDFDIGKPSDNI